MNKYRIITNGQYFRIEEYKNVGFWIWSKNKWVEWEKFEGFDPIGPIYGPANFTTREEAQATIDKLQRIYAWTTVDEG